MSSSATRHFSAVLMLWLLASVSMVSADPVCTRTYPDFTSRIFFADSGVWLPDHLDLDGDGVDEVLFIAEESLGETRIRRLHRVLAAPGGTLRAEELGSWEPFRLGLDVPPRMFSGDFDGDGLRDFALWQAGAWQPGVWTRNSTLDLLLQGADGRFEHAATSLAAYGTSVVMGDFDGDGRVELAITGRYGGAAVYGFVQPGDWSLLQTLGVPRARDVAAGDLDGDGADELVIVPYSDSNKLVLRLGDPGHPLQAAHDTPLPLARTLAVRSLQLDGAGKRELAVLGDSLEDESVITFMTMASPFSGLEEIGRQSSPEGERDWDVMDIGSDGLDDFVFTGAGNPIHSRFLLLLNRGDLPFEEGQRSKSTPWMVGTLDVDGDGMEDAIVASRAAGLLWYRGRPGPVFEEPFVFSPLNRQGSISVGDFNDDGHNDLLVHGKTINGMTDPIRTWVDFYAGQGDGSFEFSDSIWLGPSVNEILIRDLDRDGLTDLVRTSWGSLESRRLRVAYGLADGAFEPWVSWHVPAGAHELRMGQFDGDPDWELLCRARNHRGLHLLGRRHDFTRVDVQGREWQVGGAAFSVYGDHRLPYLLSDLDSDGLDDVVFARGPNYGAPWELSWRHALVGGGFLGEELLHQWDEPSSLLGIIEADLDLDGSVDLLVDRGGSASSYQSFKRIGHGRFLPLAEAGSFLPSYRAEALDLDGDGVLDLLGVSRGHFRRGDGSGGFAEPGPSWLLGETRADFDGDGLLDALGSSQNYPSYQLEVALNRGTPRAADAAPPSLELDLAPVVDDDAVPATFDGTWLLRQRAEDECDAWPELVTNRVDLEPMAPVETIYRFAEVDEIRFYGAPAGQPLLVLLAGRNESSLRKRWQEAQRAGGFALTRNPMLELMIRDTDGGRPASWGDRGFVPGELRLLRRITLGEHRVNRVVAYGPEYDIRFTVAVQDRAGNLVEERASYRDAIRRYCAEPNAHRAVCDE